MIQFATIARAELSDPLGAELRPALPQMLEERWETTLGEALVNSALTYSPLSATASERSKEIS